MSRFGSSWEKVRRARQHLDELTAQIVAFHATNPYPVVTRYDAEREKLVARVSKPLPLPPDLPLILGDVVHNAGTALDHTSPIVFSLAPQSIQPSP